MSPAFLVEGDLEKAFVENVCPGAPVRKVIPNGVDVTLEVVTERIITHLRLLSRRGYSPILIILDREGRPFSCDEMKIRLDGMIKAQGGSGYLIGVCDRKIENWIIADPECVGGDVSASRRAESLNGKKYIKETLGEYHETTIGVQLLRRAKPSSMRLNSRSFAAFYDLISHLDCWWLKR